MQSCTVGVNKVTKMKANMADEPYVVEKGKASTWLFTLTYAKLDSFMPLAQEQLVMSRLPAAERWGPGSSWEPAVGHARMHARC